MGLPPIGIFVCRLDPASRQLFAKQPGFGSLGYENGSRNARAGEVGLVLEPEWYENSLGSVTSTDFSCRLRNDGWCLIWRRPSMCKETRSTSNANGDISPSLYQLAIPSSASCLECRD